MSAIEAKALDILIYFCDDDPLRETARKGLTALQRDQDRLEWLESNPHFEHYYDDEWNLSKLPMKISDYEFVVNAPTFREAIDAAMEAES